MHDIHFCAFPLRIYHALYKQKNYVQYCSSLFTTGIEIHAHRIISQEVLAIAINKVEFRPRFTPE